MCHVFAQEGVKWGNVGTYTRLILIQPNVELF